METPGNTKSWTPSWRFVIITVLLGANIVFIRIILALEIGDSTGDVTETKNQKSAPCEDDWIWYRGKCYYFSTIRDTWTDSQRFCESHDASLALIDNKEELDFLFQFKGSDDNRWIGLRRTDDNTAWTWTDGTLYNESLFIIQRSSEETIEHVYLTHQSVRSDRGTIKFRWICNRM